MTKRHHEGPEHSSLSKSHKKKRINSFPDLSNNPDNNEFNILQGYRTIDNDVDKQKVDSTRNADINIAVTKLNDIDSLFNKTVGIQANRNSLLAYDSRAMLNVSELAQISIRSLKLNESKKLLNCDDVVNSMKKWMLEEYLKDNNIEVEDDDSEDLSDHEQNHEEDYTQDQFDEASGGNNDTKKITQREKKRTALAKYESFTDFFHFNWYKLGCLYKQVSLKPNLVEHMLGPLDVERKKRVYTAKTKSDVSNSKSTTAEKITNETLNDSVSTTTPEQVKLCFKILKQKMGYKSINLFKFIIDPESFSNSVENMFYISFLIKDGRLVMETDPDDGFPTIRLIDRLPKDSHARETEIQRRIEMPLNHIIFQLDIPTWEKLIKYFDIKTAFIRR
ncbi:related to Non-structural maintenance of chromosome element 4 [Saccharomycodes ludwigii]|uniref:Non-structural maintenance of chromosomes element 4 n=1 Tax=Saccharomycodes ludwigii TaxID=36035 RepID=A0A376B816_9ASCO|nr:hypothetical protein SCDLUD_002691 [Saccharomycodes ludwigii]KAH3901205.1 hypothetical protein SCDLUD_002691 [Saccharomycodes ludwigii]SSD60644.1 related to Non-structural maintenance of chromosome element 4 [Saccharomycodes ludwigii]